MMHKNVQHTVLLNLRWTTQIRLPRVFCCSHRYNTFKDRIDNNNHRLWQNSVKTIYSEFAPEYCLSTMINDNCDLKLHWIPFSPKTMHIKSMCRTWKSLINKKIDPLDSLHPWNNTGLLETLASHTSILSQGKLLDSRCSMAYILTS